MWESGQAVQVEYLAELPSVARIVGARVNAGGAGGAWVAVFPLCGFGMVGWFLVARRRMRRLLVHGRIAELHVLNVEATRMQVNYQTLYKVTLSAPPETPGQALTIKRWQPHEIELLTQRALNKQPVYVLYDVNRPKGCAFPESWLNR